MVSEISDAGAPSQKSTPRDGSPVVLFGVHRLAGALLSGGLPPLLFVIPDAGRYPVENGPSALGESEVGLFPQRFALGWYISPLQGSPILVHSFPPGGPPVHSPPWHPPMPGGVALWAGVVSFPYDWGSTQRLLPLRGGRRWRNCLKQSRFIGKIISTILTIFIPSRSTF